MASSSSFDVVSDFDRQELVNTLDQTRREIKSRYDLKDTKTTVELKENSIDIETDSDMTLRAVHVLMQTKAAKRSLSMKIFDFGDIDAASGSRVRQEIKLKKGIEKEEAKKIYKLLKDKFKKVQATKQRAADRVTAKRKDDLQEAMQLIKGEDWPMALQFNNYR